MATRRKDTVHPHWNASTHPIDLADGRILAPGDRVTLGAKLDPHDQLLIDDGVLVHLVPGKPVDVPTRGEDDEVEGIEPEAEGFAALTQTADALASTDTSSNGDGAS